MFKFVLKFSAWGLNNSTYIWNAWHQIDIMQKILFQTAMKGLYALFVWSIMIGPRRGCAGSMYVEPVLDRRFMKAVLQLVKLHISGCHLVLATTNNRSENFSFFIRFVIYKKFIIYIPFLFFRGAYACFLYLDRMFLSHHLPPSRRER